MTAAGLRDDAASAREYGEAWADIYDSYPAHPTAEDAEPAAALLHELLPPRTGNRADATGGHGGLGDGAPSALELGVGTGRVAVPLAARGVRVHGVDASPEMLARIPRRPGGRQVTAEVGDITAVRVGRAFDLVFAVFNTVLMVPSQEGQVRCFATAAAHLRPGGHFVVEAFVPDFTKLAGTEQVLVRAIDDDGAWLLSSRHDALRQHIRNETIRVGTDGVRRFPILLRYAWPAELDLMARLAGFHLVARYGDWQRSPLTTASRNQISVYRLDPPGPPAPP